MRAFVVDDEPLARRRLTRMLVAHEDVDIVGEADSAATAIAGIHDLEPEVVFLDIEMPGATGLDVARAIAHEPNPVVVFVTAFSEHAVEAFDAEAADYLLKPFDVARLDRALDRVRARVREGHSAMAASQLIEVLDSIRREERYLRRVAVTTGTKGMLIPVEDIDWIKADRNYAVLHQGNKQHYFRSTLADLERRLDPAKFVRVHRSSIVQVNRVRELRTLPNGTHQALLRDGTTVSVSQPYWSKILQSF